MQSATLSISAPPRQPTIESEPRRLTPMDIAESVAAIRETYSRGTSAAGVCVADGMGLRLSVERGALVVTDGIGDHCRTRRFDKATHRLRRLVVMGTTGTFSIDALHWCSRLGIGVIVLAHDGTVQLASTPRLTDDARLRRTQALAAGETYGLDVARWLISRKLVGQGALLLRRFTESEVAETIGDLALGVEDAATIDEIRQLEASAAALYFGAWSGRPESAPRFAAKDRIRIPPHWSRYEGRRSVLASSVQNRKAERPVNAILNYLYALVEAEAILACQAVGLDPGLGLMHADARARASLALDVMEPVRLEVDDFVLGLLEQRTFRKVEFVEAPDGHVRLRSPLTHELAETMPQWSKSLGPVAEHVVHVFGKAMVGTYAAATPLTSRRHRDAQALVKARKASAKTAAATSTRLQKPVSTNALPLWTCPDCGGAVTNPRHVRCDACIAADPAQAPGGQGTAWRRHRRPQAGTVGLGQGQPRRDLRPGGVQAGDPAEAQDGASCRDHRGDRLLKGVCLGHPAWEADAACVGLARFGGDGRSGCA